MDENDSVKAMQDHKAEVENLKTRVVLQEQLKCKEDECTTLCEDVQRETNLWVKESVDLQVTLLEQRQRADLGKEQRADNTGNQAYGDTQTVISVDENGAAKIAELRVWVAEKATKLQEAGQTIALKDRELQIATEKITILQEKLIWEISNTVSGDTIQEARGG